MPFYCEGGGMLSINGDKIFTRNLIIESDKTESIRKRFNNKDCYISAYRYDSQDLKTANLYGAYYIDLDYQLNSTEDLRILQYDLLQIIAFLRHQCDIPSEFIKIYFSGCKGFHILIDPVIFGINSVQTDLNLKYKAFTKYISDNIISYKTIDLKIYDRSRLFRMVNSINMKTGLYKVPVNFEFATKCTFEELVKFASHPKLLSIKREQPLPINKAIDKFNDAVSSEMVQINKRNIINRNGRIFEVLPCINEMIRVGATQGNRNSTCIIVASALFQSGKTEEEVYAALQEWNSNTTPSLSDKEIRSVIKSAIKEYNSGKGYGCYSIKMAGYCLGAECRCYK